MEVLARVERQHSQTAYAGLKKSLQQEWDFIQSVTPVVGGYFIPFGEALHNSFLLALLRGSTAEVPDWGVIFLPVNHVGMSISNPTLSTLENWTASCVVTGHLIVALQGRT